MLNDGLSCLQVSSRSLRAWFAGCMMLACCHGLAFAQAASPAQDDLSGFLQEKGLVANMHVARHQRIARNRYLIPHLAIVRDMARPHDVVIVAHPRHRFRLRPA